MDITLENSDIKDQIRNLQQTYEASMDKLREKQRQLEVAQVENQLLKMKVNCGLTCRLPPDLFSSFLLFLLPFSTLSFPFLCCPHSWISPPFCGNRCRAWFEGTEEVSVSTAINSDWGWPVCGALPLGTPALAPVAETVITALLLTY